MALSANVGPMENRTVLVTGAAGKIASQVLPALRERYDLTLLDLRVTSRQGQSVEGVQVADLLNREGPYDYVIQWRL